MKTIGWTSQRTKQARLQTQLFFVHQWGSYGPLRLCALPLGFTHIDDRLQDIILLSTFQVVAALKSAACTELTSF